MEQTWRQKIEGYGVLPVIEIDDAQKAVPLADALAAGGLPCAEITFRTAAAAEAIRQIHAARPGFLLAAGTVLSAQQADEAMAAGAQLLVSPGFSPAVSAHCAGKDYPHIPGVCTPTEVEAAMSAGHTVLKLFPAEVSGGAAMLRALHGPYRTARFMPTGGVKMANLAEYLRCPAVFACGGTWIAPPEQIAAGAFDRIRAAAAAAAAAVAYVKEVRG